MKKLFMYMMMAVTAIPLMAQNYLTLRYDRPADYWLEALPLGNGRLGAMVYGGVTSDTIQINEDTFWAGSPYNNINPNAKAHLQEIRDCINRGDYEQAQRLAMSNITADINVTAHGMAYESLGNIVLDFKTPKAAPTAYSRTLDLTDAVARVSYTADGVGYNREIFTSLADNVLVMRLTASKGGKISFTTSFKGPEKEKRVKARRSGQRQRQSAAGELLPRTAGNGEYPQPPACHHLYTDHSRWRKAERRPLKRHADGQKCRQRTDHRGLRHQL